MSVHQPLRGTTKRRAIQFELNEFNNDVDPERDAAELARVIQAALDKANRRQLTIGGTDPESLDRFDSQEEYQEAVEPLRPLTQDETIRFIAVSARFRNLDFLLREIEAWEVYPGDLFEPGSVSIH